MVRVFVNSRPLDVAAGATVVEAIRAWNPAAALELERGERQVLDDRGLPAARDARVHGGSILRLTPVRRQAG